jgi:hypothetical protein
MLATPTGPCSRSATDAAGTTDNAAVSRSRHSPRPSESWGRSLVAKSIMPTRRVEIVRRPSRICTCSARSHDPSGVACCRFSVRSHPTAPTLKKDIPIEGRVEKKKAVDAALQPTT